MDFAASNVLDIKLKKFKNKILIYQLHKIKQNVF